MLSGLKFKIGFGVLTGSAAVFLLILLNDVDRYADVFFQSFTHWQILLSVFVLYGLAFILRTFAWTAILPSGGFKNLGLLFGAINTSLVLNHILPLKAGDIARPVVASKSDIPLATTTVTTLIARVTDFATVILIAFLFIFVADTPPFNAFLNYWLILPIGSVLGILAVIAVRRVMPRLQERLARLNFYNQLRALSPTRYLLLIVLSAGAWLLEGIVLYGAGSMSGIEVSFLVAITVTALTVASQTIHVTPGGLGVYEFVMSGALILTGMDVGEALLLATFTHTLKFAYTFLVAVPFSLTAIFTIPNFLVPDRALRVNAVQTVTSFDNRLNIRLLGGAVFTGGVLVAYFVDSVNLLPLLFASVMVTSVFCLGLRFSSNSESRSFWWVLTVPGLLSILVFSVSLPIVTMIWFVAAFCVFKIYQYSRDYLGVEIDDDLFHYSPQLIVSGLVFFGSVDYFTASGVTALSIGTCISIMLSIGFAALIWRQWTANWKARWLHTRLRRRTFASDITSHFNSPIVVIIPVLNEAKTLPILLKRIFSVIPTGSTVFVVNDGSIDGSDLIARNLGAEVINHEHNLGLGAALRTGMKAAAQLNPVAAVYIDADLEYDPLDMPKLLLPILAGDADYVIGSRFRGVRENHPFFRGLGNRCFTLLTSLLAGQLISDGQSGFRAFSTRALREAEIIHDYNYAQVLTLNLLKKHMILKEVAINYQYRQVGQSFISLSYLWRVPLGIAREMWRP